MATTEDLPQFADAGTARREELARMKGMEEQVRNLTDKVRELAETCEKFKQFASGVSIQTFGEEPFELVKPILVSVQESDGEFIASFHEANVSVQADTRQQAIDELTEAILSEFDFLDSLPDEKLGIDPKRRLAVLREFIRRRQ